MFYCDDCRIKNNYPEGALGYRSTGQCELCKKIASCHDVSAHNIGIYQKEFPMESFRFASTSLFHAPGMCLNYQRARQMHDKGFCKMFENGFNEDTPREALDSIAEGKFVIEGNDVIVSVPAQQGV